ncbi:MAG: 4-vinyl reductase [Candidatus Diapherotrites archaeon]
MIDLFQKLLMMQQIKFEEGNIRLFGRRMVLSPAEMPIAMTDYMLNHPQAIPEIYEKIRVNIETGWAEAVHDLYKFGRRNYIDTMKDIGTLSGWGNHQFLTYDAEKLEGLVRTPNSPVGEYYKNKVKEPVDHIFRGLAAGVGSAILKKEMDWIETKCIGKGDPYCEMLFKLRENITSEERKKYINQLP